jgi:hypothetical protein
MHRPFFGYFILRNQNYNFLTPLTTGDFLAIFSFINRRHIGLTGNLVKSESGPTAVIGDSGHITPLATSWEGMLQEADPKARRPAYCTAANQALWIKPTVGSLSG